MKSAFELAMERLGGPVRTLTPEQKEQLAEVDREFDARLAQVRLSAAAPSPDEDAAKRQAREDALKDELRSLERRREERKDALRKSFGV